MNDAPPSGGNFLGLEYRQMFRDSVVRLLLPDGQDLARQSSVLKETSSVMNDICRYVPVIIHSYTFPSPGLAKCYERWKGQKLPHALHVQSQK